MKHIKRKFLIEANSDTIQIFKSKSELITDIDKGIDPSILSKKKNQMALMETDDNEIIKGFVQNINGKNYLIPIPDLTLVYFSSAQNNLRASKVLREKMLKKLDPEIPNIIPPIHEIYDYYGTICSTIINLFTTLESFINQLIPEKYIYKRANKKSTEIFSYAQILENIDFKTKVTEIIPEISKKDFFQKSSPVCQRIWNLKKFRDDIIHTKPEDNLLVYRDLIKKALNYKYDDAVLSVERYLNYHKPNYVVECDCGKDF